MRPTRKDLNRFRQLLDQTQQLLDTCKAIEADGDAYGRLRNVAAGMGHTLDLWVAGLTTDENDADALHRLGSEERVREVARRASRRFDARRHRN